MAAPLSARLVQIESDLGEGTSPRWRYGSGCIVAARTVLTAAHVVAGAQVITIRDRDKRESPASLVQGSVGEPDEPDLALIEIDDPAALGLGPNGLSAIRLARVNRDSETADAVADCHAFGYPAFTQTTSPSGTKWRDSVDAFGTVPVLSHLARGLLSVVVTQCPRPLPDERNTLGESEWSGMSGGPLVVEGMLLGVIDEHAPREGPSAITAIPLTALEADPNHPGWGGGVEDPAAWWTRLGAASVDDLAVMPRPSAALSGDPEAVARQFTAGMSALATDYEVRLANFLVEYLGSAERPVPFGGRATDLERLEDWLTNPSASPYMLLTAPAGGGKSALLVHWLERLVAEDVAVVFIPISIRFRTSQAGVAFAATAARLAKINDRALPSTIAVSAEEWRGLVAEYLKEPRQSESQLLLILDGVDEATDWELGPDLFPLEPPPKLRVVVSARTLADDRDAASWLDRLGWSRPGLASALVLDRLDQRGVAEVLNSASITADQAPSADGDLPTELYAVSEGDPLVVRLYVDALTAPGDLESHRRDLPTRPPGLDGYFERWWDEQRQLWGRDAPLREPAVRSLLNLLAGALGPLTPDDFLALDRTLDSWNLEEAMLPLRRLITGDRSAGYAYAHPRLADHFYSRLQQAGQRALEMEFVEWGRDALRNLVAMDGTAVLPAYLSQHWASHLRRAGLRKELFAVVRDDRWYRLQLAADPTEGAFIQDLETAWAEADTENPHSPSDGTSVNLLADALEYALAIASLRSRSSNLPPAALPYLIEERSWSVRQAFAAARQYPDPENRAEAFAVLGDTLTDARERVAAGEQL